jgi:DNA-binding response OmpR family regulator
MTEHDAVAHNGKLYAGPITLDLDRYAVHVYGHAVDLTRVEFNLLEFLVRHSDRVVSHADLLQRVLGRTGGDGGSLIRVHVAHLRRKLGAASVAIQTVRGRGLLLYVDSAPAFADTKSQRP